MPSIPIDSGPIDPNEMYGNRPKGTITNYADMLALTALAGGSLMPVAAGAVGLGRAAAGAAGSWATKSLMRPIVLRQLLEEARQAKLQKAAIQAEQEAAVPGSTGPNIRDYSGALQSAKRIGDKIGMKSQGYGGSAQVGTMGRPGAGVSSAVNRVSLRNELGLDTSMPSDPAYDLGPSSRATARTPAVPAPTNDPMFTRNWFRAVAAELAKQEKE